jgi:cytoskeleton protein RodZ
MNEMTGAAAAPVAAPSAGRLLREARERQGLHIAALAASIKVTQKKLELLEADRFDALPDATFARALALTICRALKIDSAAVLRLLPPAGGHRLEQVGEGLNAPFRERPGVLVQREGTAMSFGWIFWLTTLILIAAAVVYFLPSGLLSRVAARTSVAAPAAPAVTGAPPVTGALVVPEAPVAPLPVPAPAAAPSDSDIFPPGVTAPLPPAEAMPAETSAPPPARATSNGGSGR